MAAEQAQGMFMLLGLWEMCVQPWFLEPIKARLPQATSNANDCLTERRQMAERAHRIFTLLGLRHLVVVNEASDVRGMQCAA